MTTETDLRKGFTLGPWEVLPDRGLLRDGKKRKHLEPLVMRVLVALAVVQGEVLSKDDLIEIVWDGRALSDEPLNRCISILRRKLGDDSRNPTYIQNIPRVGYRLMMPVHPASTPEFGLAPANLSWQKWAAIAAVALLALMLGIRSVIDMSEQRLAMRSIAIYPFTCAGETEDYMCFGFSEELTSTLLHTSQIKIVKFREPLPMDRPPREIAQSLHVDGLLIGSVQQIGDRLKISVELIDGENGFIILSDTLDGSISDVFSLQEQVASVVENAMFGSSGEPVRSLSRPANFAAFEAYARGQFQFERRTRSAIEESIQLFEKTIELDPMFGPAYLRLAHAYLLLPEYDSSLSIEEMYDLAAETTRAGVAADAQIRELAGTVFGFIHHKRGEWAAAHAAFELAASADTVFPLTHNWYSRFLATVGRLDDALKQAQLAYEHAPDNATIVSRLAVTNLWVSDLDAAGRYFDIANKMGQENPIHDLGYAMYLIRVGDVAAAQRFTETGLEKYGFDASWVGPVYRGIEDPALREQSVALVAELEAGARMPKFIALALLVVLGEVDRAIQTAMSIEGIGQDFETGYEVMFSDDLKIVREHDDFQRLLESTGLIEYWSQAGCVWASDRVRCEDL